LLTPSTALHRNFPTGAMNAGSGDFPDALDAAISKGRKIVLYHGFSGGFITPFRTIQYFETLARCNGGYAPLGQNVRLFMVTGMSHCSGGPGPNSFGQSKVTPLHSSPAFDAAAALEQWVEMGLPPEMFVATHLPDSAASPVPGGEGFSCSASSQRSMPLCRFPAAAKYNEIGDVNEAANGHCPVGDTSLLGRDRTESRLDLMGSLHGHQGPGERERPIDDGSMSALLT
jgi:feruloyl esterase